MLIVSLPRADQCGAEFDKAILEIVFQLVAGSGSLLDRRSLQFRHLHLLGHGLMKLSSLMRRAAAPVTVPAVGPGLARWHWQAPP